jgi:hypothetical protein
MKTLIVTLLASAIGSMASASIAHAEDAAPAAPAPAAPSAPAAAPVPSALALGGHLGLAIPILSIAQKTTGIGSDFFTIGISAGVTTKLDEHWAFDFEFVAYNEFKATPSLTSFVFDPGVIYNFGSVVVGGRVATKLGGGQITNVGVVPIIVAPFKISSRLSYFIEADVPIFFSDKESTTTGTLPGMGVPPTTTTTPGGIQPSVGLQIQTGIGF